MSLVVKPAHVGHDYGECEICGEHHDCGCQPIPDTAPIRLRAEKAEAEVARLRAVVGAQLAGYDKLLDEFHALQRAASDTPEKP